MGDISNIPAEILHNIFLRVTINLLVKIRYVCKRWNRVISDPYFAKSCKVGERKILLPFEPVDVLDENDTTTRSMVTLDSSPFWKLERGKVVTLVGSYNGIVLLVIQDCRNQLSFYDDHTDYMVLYNPLTRESKRIPDNSHSTCNSNAKHVYGFGYGSSTPDDVKIVRFRGCEFSSSSANDNWHTCDIFSTKTNSWTVLENFVQNANSLNDVGTFANGSLYWIADSKDKIMALDVSKIVLSYIHVPWYGLHGLYYGHVLGTLDGFLCIVGQSWSGQTKGIDVRIILEEVKGVDKPSWITESSSYDLDLKSYSPISILDDGIILILIRSSQELVIYDVFKHSHKVIKISASHEHHFRRSHCGIEYVESLVSPSTLFN